VATQLVDAHPPYDPAQGDGDDDGVLGVAENRMKSGIRSISITN
jgi:hypothetical protein